jgi:prepilin-type N-terminal cleavage/methylation domain-containing protein
MIAPAGRRGFTLVELLVVTGLIGSLLAIVVVGLRSEGSEATQLRRSAQAFASALLAAQSRAIGNPSGAGVLIDPIGVQGLVISSALMQPMITGSVSNGMPPSDPAVTSATIQVTPTNADLADLIHGYQIMFGPPPAGDPAQLIRPESAWFSYAPLTTGSAVVRFRPFGGQTGLNTIWPRSEGEPVYATIARYPSKGDAVATMDKLVAVDLRHSGMGSDPSTGFGRLDGKGAVAVTFDRTGSVREIMQSVLATTARSTDPQIPKQPIYFLVAPRADIDNSSVNVLSRQDVVWVTIFPQTGRVAVSSNVPQTGTDTAALIAARANATLGIPIGK